MNQNVSPLCSNGTTRPATNGNSVHDTNGHSGQTVRLMLLLSTSLDCESMTALLSRRRGLELVGATPDLDFGLACCRQLRPKLLILDPKVHEQAIDSAVATVRSGYVRHVMVLDDRVHEGRLAELLPMPGVSYMTRLAGADSLYAAVIKSAMCSVRVFDPAIDHRVQRTSRGLRLEQHRGQPSVAGLTNRERQVMLLLAQGQSVRDCAQQMQLAVSTIDNHKSRLMKKLRIHKAAELTHIAIRDGLITV